ncbi:M23 family metallopeptidase [Rhizobium sp. SL86]|uniref:M23 family metallopeptidase n=1 Tax=Rhizobium sp. SL86 TaxID=2995148 RepID=UPI002276227B|nr:M23 family metallopeptidase [Rhizobium sp. SL86]MCY1668819.1 M23 family metallopeptidase [Rhizobium sp. SL86]
MAGTGDHRVFGKRTTQHVLILASGDRLRHMVIRPWMTATAICFIALFTIGYLAATTYLVLRDDLIAASMARQARIQHDYEDRISALRAQLDRITSRQLLDQQVVEQKVEKLLEQQNALFSRHGKLGNLMERAEEQGLTVDSPQPVNAFQPVPKEKQAGLAGGLKAIDRLLATDPHAAARSSASAFAPAGESVADRADRVFSKVTLSLKAIEQEQFARIHELTANADRKADAMASIMRRTGVALPAEDADNGANGGKSKNGLGGPFVEPIGVNAFDASLDRLDTALNRLDTVRQTAKELPFANPAPGRDITSPFGNRIDPFLGRLALHAGIDFEADVGTAVRATGSGKVISAGYSGGYGNMVEIDHGQGITTRFGHLSSILVSVGDQVEAGAVIGRAGSTGRSTGPHIHYEVRRNGDAIDPMRFLNAGLKLTTYM